MKRLLLCLLLLPVVSFAKIQLVFWHAMAGELGVAVTRLAEQFNASQPYYQVVPMYKGDYAEVLTTTIAAFRANKHPDIVQIYEIATATMMFPPGAIKPVAQLMAETNIPFNADDLIPVIRDYYSDIHGQLLAMPFNSSSPVLYYNRDAFKKVGLNPDKPPVTWPEVKKIAERFIAQGYQCGFTTVWAAWIHLESFAAWHNLPFATQDNGFASLNPKVKIATPYIIEHVETLNKWQKNKIFVYGGRGDNATALFTSEQCPMITASSGSSMSFKKSLNFDVGVSTLPYWPHIKGAPQNTSIGGAAIWIMQYRPLEHYPGIAQFIAFMARKNTQLQWQRDTGYLPVTFTANADKNSPAFNSLTLHPPTAYSRGIRLGNFAQIRRIHNQALEAVWSGQKSAEQALLRASRQDDRLLEQFRKNVS